MIELKSATAQAHRMATARRLLLELGVGEPDPHWSSEVLDRLVATVVEVTSGSPADLLTALYELLGEPTSVLTQPVANLIKELVIQCFTKHRLLYDKGDWGAFAANVSGAATPAQLYLALHALPPRTSRVNSRV